MARVSVTNEATRVDSADATNAADPGRGYLIRNRSSVSLFIDFTDEVTTSTGFELEVDEAVSVDLERGETLYAIASTAGPHRLDVLAGGVA